MTALRTYVLVLSFSSGAFLACSRKARVDETNVRADPVTSAIKDGGTAEPPVDLGPPGVASIVPPVPASELGMMDHSDEFGWSKDGKVFGYCQTDGGMGARHCRLFPRIGGPPEMFDDIDRTTDEPDPKKTAAIAARIKKLAMSVAPPTWRFARDLEITWKSVEGDSMASPETPGVLMVGARVRGEPPSWAISLSVTSTPYYSHIHPEAIAVSPDGEVLAVMGHAFAGEFSDHFEVQLVPTARVAAKAYEAAGRAHRDKGDQPGAAMFFRKAMMADPTYHLAPPG